MKIAIMQPYIFPYIGYFQLINKVDKFIIYDDVSFIKQGWINRNYILVAGKPMLFTLPIEQISSNKLIKDTSLNKDLYLRWRDKFLATLILNYKKAPYYNAVFDKIKSVLESEASNMTELLVRGLQMVSTYLEMKTIFIKSSDVYNHTFKGQERVIDICKKENALEYYNLVGGKTLYSKEQFALRGIKLHFIEPKKSITYKQGKNSSFVPWLSIIDVLMFNSPEEIGIFLNEHEIT